MNDTRWPASRPGMEPKMKIEATMVSAMTMTAQTDDSYPTEIPCRMRVAGPVSAPFLISLTGEACVPVKYSVRRSIKIASSTPAATAMGVRHQPPHEAISGLLRYKKPAPKNSTAEMAAEERKPRKIASRALPLLPGPPRTTYVPMMDESTPMPRTMSG